MFERTFLGYREAIISNIMNYIENLFFIHNGEELESICLAKMMSRDKIYCILQRKSSQQVFIILFVILVIQLSIFTQI